MDHRTLGDKIGDSIAKFGSSWTFIFVATGILTVWVIINTFAFFSNIAFDAYPYVFLNLMLSCVAAFQAPFIMMSQRRCEVKQDQAYRFLFKEIKDLVESDLQLENQLYELSVQQSIQLEELKKFIVKSIDEIDEPDEMEV